MDSITLPPRLDARKSGIKSKRITFLIPGEMAPAIDAICAADGRSVSEVFRDAMRLYLRARLPGFSLARQGQRQYTNEELARIVERLQNDPGYAQLRAEEIEWDQMSGPNGQ